MIRVRHLEKRFGARPVLNRLSLDVHPGVVTLLAGANGAGKTTLLRTIVGLARPDHGTVLVDGIDIVRRRHAAVEALSFLPQAPRFHPRLRTQQVARYHGQLRGRPAADVDEELRRWGLHDHLHATTAELSGGLRQRLAIAIFALARAPVLVLDEPGLSLDPEWRSRLQAHLTSMAAAGATVLVATHLLGEWEGRIDACVLLQHGRVGGALPPDRLRASFPLAASVVAT